MRVNFGKIIIHNFMSFKDEEFDFSANKGMNLICGKNLDIPGSKNGVGKTAILNALVYGLFGEITTKVNNKNLHNKYIEGKEMSVSVYFDINGTNKYKVVSGFDKYGMSYCNLYMVDNKEIDITKSSIAETRRFLENEILHFDISIFLRSILLTSDQNYNFFLLDKANKNKFIEKLFNITIFGFMYKLIHSDVLQMEKNIFSKQNELLLLKKKLSEYQEHINNFISNKNEQIENIRELISNEKEKYKDLTSKNIDINNDEVEKYENECSTINDKLKKIKLALDSLENKKEKFEKSLFKISTKIDSKKSMITKHNSILDVLCDDCRKTVRSMYKIDEMVSEIDTLNEESEKTNKNINEIDIKKTTIENEKNRLDKELEKIKGLLDNLTESYRETEKQKEDIKAKISSLTAKLDTLNEMENPYLNLKENVENDIQKTDSEINDLNSEYKYLEFASNIVSQDTLKKFIIKDIIHVLNNRIKTYLSKLGANFTCKFDENMVYHFITEGGETEYGAFSAGERMRLMIASSFAFRDFMAIRNNLVSNIILLDEFIDGNIDQVAIDGIIEIMKEFINSYQQNVYIISHRKELQNDIFDHIIQVYKENNISTIKYL